MRFYLILFILAVSSYCTDSPKSSKNLDKLALLSQTNSSSFPQIGSEKTNTTTTSPTLGAGESYQSRYLPQNFSLKIPTQNFVNSGNQVDLSKCYIDQSVEWGDVQSTNSRLCGITFDQVKLELHALFLDLALPDIRAMCKNKLPTCDLAGKEVSIVISEPVMRTIEKLYAFYDYVGLNKYFQYNGYELRNGMQLPFQINLYEEIDHPVYEYRAVFRQRVLSTRGTEVEERPGAADITVYWNKNRHNILFQFHGYAEVFDYKINARRVYNYSLVDRKIDVTTELDYWNVLSTQSFRFGQSTSVVECVGKTDCVEHKGIGGFFLGSDSEKNGLGESEIYYHSLRTSAGISSLSSGLLFNSYPETGRTDEILIHQTGNQLLFVLEPGYSSKNWKISLSSPNQNLADLNANSYWMNSVNTNGQVLTNRVHAISTKEALLPTYPKTILWQSTGNPDLPHNLNGYSLNGIQTNLKFRFADIQDSSYRSVFLPDGTRNYLQ